MTTSEPKNDKKYTVKDFLETVSPGVVCAISDMVGDPNTTNGQKVYLPQINLHCDSDSCNGIRIFKTNDDVYVYREDLRSNFIKYTCKNCSRSEKIFSLWTTLNKAPSTDGALYKFGEFPNFGPPTPSRVLRMIEQSEIEYYQKGRRSENQGLGIAAFAYYRRIVESQKNKIIEEIIRVTKKIEPSNTNLLAELEEAKKEIQFSKAVSKIKHAIPQALLVDGHNPLLLLHNALSDGLHDQSDEHCLDLATSIRVLLTDFTERASQALKEEAELKSAVSKLLSIHAKKQEGNREVGD